MRTIRDVTLVVLTLLGAIGFSQVPRFVQEYEQRLGGALQEARRQLAQYESLARNEGLPLEAFWQRLGASGDRSVAAVGRSIGAQAERAASLGAQAQALENAGRFMKPLVLLRQHDPELVAATWAKYEYTLTLDIGFAAAGALAGLLLNAVLWAVVLGRHRGQPRSA
jgi:Protein of unknown function (DUF2937)